MHLVGGLFGARSGRTNRRRDAEYGAVSIPMNSWADDEGKAPARTVTTATAQDSAENVEEQGDKRPQQEQLLRRHMHGSSEASAGEYNHENPATPMAYDPLQQSTEYNAIGTAR